VRELPEVLFFLHKEPLKKDWAGAFGRHGTYRFWQVSEYKTGLAFSRKRYTSPEDAMKGFTEFLSQAFMGWQLLYVVSFHAEALNDTPCSQKT